MVSSPRATSDAWNSHPSPGFLNLPSCQPLYTWTFTSCPEASRPIRLGPADSEKWCQQWTWLSQDLIKLSWLVPGLGTGFSFEGNSAVIASPRYRKKGTGSQRKNKEIKEGGKGWSKCVHWRECHNRDFWRLPWDLFYCNTYSIDQSGVIGTGVPHAQLQAKSCFPKVRTQLYVESSGPSSKQSAEDTECHICLSAPLHLGWVTLDKLSELLKPQFLISNMGITTPISNEMMY